MHGKKDDVLSTFFDDSKIAWYENLTIAGIDTRKEPVIPASFRLSQNYPNPFNNSTIINYQLSKTSQVDLSIFNILGKKVITLVSEKQQAGGYRVEWDASKLAGGVYLYRLEAGEYVETRKMMLLK